MKIKRAIISVSDKQGLAKFAKELYSFGVEILSSQGTKTYLARHGIKACDISDFTGFPEILDGRVKTLHPKIHGGILAVTDKTSHRQQLKKNKILPIDMVVVDLYPFSKAIKKKNISMKKAVENIDIGGVALLRAAAKNYKYTVSVCSPDQYSGIISSLKKNNGSIPKNKRLELSADTFKHTANYELVISSFLSGKLKKTSKLFPEEKIMRFQKFQDLRYGENPHQKAAFYLSDPTQIPGLTRAAKLHGKELSYNNILDLCATGGLLSEFREPFACIVKHTNPCGAATGGDIVKAFKKAHQSDPLSAFGGIVGINRSVDERLAREIIKAGFLECILAPGFSIKALGILTQKKNLRLLKLPNLKKAFRENTKTVNIKNLPGGALMQTADTVAMRKGNLKKATKKHPSRREMTDLLFAWKIVKYVKSNAIVLARNEQVVGIGSGLTSRVDAVFMACQKAGGRADGAVLASDAFFPKPDNITIAHKAGVRAIIQSGGSIADQEVINRANQLGVAMVFTGMRHFKH